MASEIDEYLDQIERTETHANHLANLLGRMYESWRVLSRLTLRASKSASPELSSAIIGEVNRFEGLMQELREVVETVILDRASTFRAVAALMLWAQKTISGK